MKLREAQANGIEPVEHVVAIDALAIITNLENPVSELTIQQTVRHVYRANHELEGCWRQ